MDQFPTNVTKGEPGAWPYMDFLMTGGEGCAPYEEGITGMHCPQQTDDMYRTEFAIWSITQSPLIVSTDVRNMSDVMAQTLLNEELIVIHQDTSTAPGRLMARQAGCEACHVWGRELPNSEWLVVLVNHNSNSSETVEFSFEQMGWSEDA